MNLFLWPISTKKWFLNLRFQWSNTNSWHVNSSSSTQNIKLNKNPKFYTFIQATKCTITETCTSKIVKRSSAYFKWLIYANFFKQWNNVTKMTQKSKIVSHTLTTYYINHNLKCLRINSIKVLQLNNIRVKLALLYYAKRNEG